MSSSDISFLQRQPGANIDGWDLHIPRVKPQLFQLHIYIHNTEPKYLLYEALQPRGFQHQTDQAMLKDRKVHNVVCKIFHYFCWTGGNPVAQGLKTPVWVPESPLWSGTARTHRGFQVCLLTAENLQPKGKIQLDQILHSSTAFKACVIPLQSISIYTAITEQNYGSQSRKPLLIQKQVWIKMKKIWQCPWSWKLVAFITKMKSCWMSHWNIIPLGLWKRWVCVLPQNPQATCTALRR